MVSLSSRVFSSLSVDICFKLARVPTFPVTELPLLELWMVQLACRAPPLLYISSPSIALERTSGYTDPTESQLAPSTPRLWCAGQRHTGAWGHRIQQVDASPEDAARPAPCYKVTYRPYVENGAQLRKETTLAPAGVKKGSDGGAPSSFSLKTVKYLRYLQKKLPPIPSLIKGSPYPRYIANMAI